MTILEKIKKLRDSTGAGIMECQKALQKAKGNFIKATKILKKERGIIVKKLTKKTSAGLIEAYLHPNRKIGVLIQLACQSDSLARSREFISLAHDLALQIASMAPKNKKELLSQPFVKNESEKIADLLKEKIALFKENIEIRRFIRYEK